METKCEYCGEIYEVKNKYSVSSHYRYCRVFTDTKNSTLTKDFLVDAYDNIGMSLTDISLATGFSISTVYAQMKKFGINSRTVSSAYPLSVDKRKETTISRYGVDHVFCRDSSIRQQWENNLFEREGITNVFQREEVKQKIKETCIDRYGVPSPMQNDDVKMKLRNSFNDKYGIDWPICLHSSKTLFSKPHRIIYEHLIECGIDVELEHKVYPYSIDLYIPSKGLSIEVYGDYWHGNPLKYIETDVVCIPKTGDTVIGDIWSKDKKRLDFLVNKGYDKVYVIWEHDILNNLITVKDRLCQLLK